MLTSDYQAKMEEVIDNIPCTAQPVMHAELRAYLAAIVRATISAPPEPATPKEQDVGAAVAEKMVKADRAPGSVTFNWNENSEGYRSCLMIGCAGDGFPYVEQIRSVIAAAINAAVADERERCAKIAESWRGWSIHGDDPTGTQMAKEVAAEIRSAAKGGEGE